jgi:hypothetical protein
MENNKDYYQEHYFEAYEKKVSDSLPNIKFKGFGFFEMKSTFQELCQIENIEKLMSIFDMTRTLIGSIGNSVARLDSKVEVLEKRLAELERGKNGDTIG